MNKKSIKNLPKIGIKSLAIVLVVVMLTTVLCSCGVPKVLDTTFRLAVPSNWTLGVGDSRSVDVVFGYDVTDRQVSWEVEPKSVATVDKWGRVTALSSGNATVTAILADGRKSQAKVTVVDEFTTTKNNVRKIDYSGTAVPLGSNKQKVVTRYTANEIQNNIEIPNNIKDIFLNSKYSGLSSATTKDGAVWEITDYGVLRVDKNALDERDVEQRFMGFRYFASDDTSNGKVLGIVADEDCGIWTFMDKGISHIEMVAMTGIEKANYLYDLQDEIFASRRGMMSSAMKERNTNEWIAYESDNDGLWTSMHAVGELMRYAYLKENGSSYEELQQARASALLSTEAVLLLANISMRTGTVEAKVRYQPNGFFDYNTTSGQYAEKKGKGIRHINGKFLSDEALISGGNYSVRSSAISPADMYEQLLNEYENKGILRSYIFDKDYLDPFDFDSWKDPRFDTDAQYETRTRNLEGWVARSYSFVGEPYPNNGYTVYNGEIQDCLCSGYMHWIISQDPENPGEYHAKGGSYNPPSVIQYYINGENLREVYVDANGEVPELLWNDIIAVTGHTVDEIIYRGDTSQDELIGHFFLYKVAYDILDDNDPHEAEVKRIISYTMDRIAKHVSDNSYMMVDGSGQPDTWAKFNREFFSHSQQMGGGPLSSLVVLSLFKVASYVTGNPRWENEYRMCAIEDPSYQYAKLTTQYSEQCYLYMVDTLHQFYVDPILKVLKDETKDTLTRMFLNYSDEEMAMLGYYVLFQLEDDEQLLSYYREGIDDWWKSISYEENPLWYYIYQLAYPNKKINDAYGNDILETSAWVLSRHVLETVRERASNDNRDDVAEYTLSRFGIGANTAALSIDLIKSGKNIQRAFKNNNIFSLATAMLQADDIVWKIAPPDERNYHKYNESPFDMNDKNTEDEIKDLTHSKRYMDPATTYTLPYWMGLYHGLLVG